MDRGGRLRDPGRQPRLPGQPSPATAGGPWRSIPGR